MVNYSIAMMGNPAKQDEPKKAYGVAQYSEKMTLADFCEHISEHNSVYDAEDVQAILGKSVKCLREMLLAGKKVELGKFGEFSLTLQGKGAETAKEYNPTTYVEKVNVVWTPGKRFENLKDDTTFNFVASRKEQDEAKRKAKAQGDDSTSDGGDSTKDTDTSGSSSDTSQSSGDTGKSDTSGSQSGDSGSDSLYD